MAAASAAGLVPSAPVKTAVFQADRRVCWLLGVLLASAPSQSWSMPSPGTSVAPGKIAGSVSSQSVPPTDSASKPSPSTSAPRNSKAPMSLARARGKPRWSAAGAAPSSPASIAGLPAVRACVWVGPPLFASGPSSGSTPGRSPGATRLHVLSLSRLLSNETTAPSQSTAVFPATIVFCSVAVVPSWNMPPPTPPAGSVRSQGPRMSRARRSPDR